LRRQSDSFIQRIGGDRPALNFGHTTQPVVMGVGNDHSLDRADIRLDPGKNGGRLLRAPRCIHDQRAARAVDDQPVGRDLPVPRKVLVGDVAQNSWHECFEIDVCSQRVRAVRSWRWTRYARNKYESNRDKPPESSHAHAVQRIGCSAACHRRGWSGLKQPRGTPEGYHTRWEAAVG